MIVEDKRTLRLKKIAAHGFMIAFITLIMFPFLMVVSISFREGNFSVGTLIPENPTLEHWYLAFGLEFTRAAAKLPVRITLVDQRDADR